MIYIIKENGKRERYGENSISIFKAFNSISDLVSEQYGCFVDGFLVLILFINAYITAFGYGEGKEQTAIKEQIVTEKTIDKKSEITSSQSNNSKTYLDKTNNSTEKVNDKKSEMTFSQVKDLKTTLSKISDSAEKNNSISSSTAKQKIELLPLKQNNIIIYLLNTKEYFFLDTGEDNTYYSSMHYTPEKKLDWFVYSVNINEKCRLYFYKVKEEKENKKSEKYVYLFIKDNGFEVTDLEKNLLWTIEKKGSDYYLKRGPNKEFAYRFGAFKQKSSTVMNCYMVVNADNKPQSISWKKEDGLYVLDANYKTKFYIPKCNPNSNNEPALAFPNIYMLEEMDIKLRNIIAIEMSQLE